MRTKHRQGHDRSIVSNAVWTSLRTQGHFLVGRCLARTVGIVALVVCILLVATRPLCGFMQESQNTPASSAADRTLLIDVTDDDWMQWQEPRAFDPAQPSLLRIVRRLAQIDLAILARQRRAVTVLDRATAPAPGTMFHVSGNATAWRAHDVPGADAADGSHSFYLVTIERADVGKGWVVANEIPSAWKQSSFEFPASTAANMFFLGWVSEGEYIGPLFAARRLAWFPGPDTQGLGRAATSLGTARFDAGLLDLVETRPTQAIGRDESLCLLNMIRAAPAALDSAGNLPLLDVVPLLENKSNLTSEGYLVQGSIRRITPIELAGNAVAEAVGVPKYFQLDVFVPIGQRRINLASPDGADPLTFEHEFPVSVVVGELPKELVNVREPDQQVRIPAFYFRLWTFPSALSRRSDPAARQVVPLLVGGDIEIVASHAQAFDDTVTWFVVICVVAGAFFCCGLWWVSKRDARRHRSLPERVSWDDRSSDGPANPH